MVNIERLEKKLEVSNEPFMITILNNLLELTKYINLTKKEKEDEQL